MGKIISFSGLKPATATIIVDPKREPMAEARIHEDGSNGIMIICRSDEEIMPLLTEARKQLNMKREQWQNAKR